MSQAARQAGKESTGNSLLKEEIALPYAAYGMYFLEGNLAIGTKALTMSVFFDQVI